MIKNFFITSFRNLTKHKVLTSIYFVGLSISMAVSMLILIWVNYQFSFDRNDKNSSNIYRVYPHILMNGNDFTSSMAPPPLRSFLQENFPEVVAATRLYKYNMAIVNRDKNAAPVKSFNEVLYQADSAFFKVFNFKMLQGDPANALLKPHSIVITKSTAIKYFGRAAFESGNVLGQTLDINMSGWKLDCKITGITEDVPPNSHFHYKIILSDVTDAWDGSQVWVDNTYYTYLLLKKGTDPKVFESKIPAAIKSVIDPQLQANFGTTYDQLKSKGDYWEYKLQPITDIHLHSNFERELEPGVSISNVYILSIAAIFLILMACINYANLSTVNAIKRSKEIGVRKALGSSKLKLMALIFTETGIVALISALMALILITILFQPFQTLMQTVLPRQALSNPINWVIFIGLFIIISFIGGVFPAFYLSSFSVIKAIKGNIAPGKRFNAFKGTLIVVQFFMFIGLMVCMLLVKQQLNFLRDKSPGFNKENVLILTDAGVQLGGGSTAEAFMAELKKIPKVISAGICADYPNSGNDNFPISANYKRQGPDHLLANFSAGYNFLKTFDIKLLSGRDFNPLVDNDTVKRVILNEAAVKELGIENPINSVINTKYLNSLHIRNERYEVIGVADNFNFKSLRDAIQLMAIFLRSWGQYVAIRIAPGNSIATIEAIKQTWEKFVPGSPFEFHFLDERIDNLYKTEAVLSNVLDILTGLIILIAVLGLTGITLLTIQQRTKEIGIRKVLGASVVNITALISKDFLKLVIIAIVIAVPLGWIAMQQWLQNFAYRISISWWIFLVAGLMAIVIAIITVSWQAIRAARANPVKSLRTE